MNHHLIYVEDPIKPLAQLILRGIDADHITHENNIIYDVVFFDDKIAITLGQLFTNDLGFLYYTKTKNIYNFLNGEIGDKVTGMLLQQEQTKVSHYHRCHESLSDIHKEFVKTDYLFYTRSDFSEDLIADMP